MPISDRRAAPCRFCGRSPAPGEHRLPGPAGPVCADCVEAGLALVRDGRARPSLGGTPLLAAERGSDLACEFCGRRERRTFFGFRRPLARMIGGPGNAVICADCLDRAGDVLNRALRQR
ncbi:hypothetical protein FG385_31675 [Amycolatopsis alkalitolerans]|uniref:ATP-dependent Clp protease ATP-binding subunit ClpX zinc ribbon domain-containing protein n=2 Tax=Amycolatopsis alkalitolerans TaxID=2547244 RepID=A0A5C4LSX3_9PSEU|nr:hypothetical protein FG385_31675 [Amycolatopsis alkalitolerans]